MKQILKLNILFLTFFVSINSYSQIQKFKILYTNDEHGWFEKVEKYSGAAGMTGAWLKNENFAYRDSFLVLSGGDMWTGPAISTWYEGKPMTQIMKQMGYDAAVAGNHEFDFKTKTLKKNIKHQSFPVLAANITYKKNNKIPSYILPYIIFDISNIKVGIIGLANLETPKTTFPANVEKLNFAEYTPTIEKWAPVVKNKGADIIIILGHLTEEEQDSLLKTAQKFNIPLITGGHSHKKVIKTVNGVTMIQSGSGLKNYIKLDIEYNTQTKETKISNLNLVPNTGTETDSSVLAISEYWNSEAEKILSEKIGYCGETIKNSSYEIENFVCDAWLSSFPEADIAITNGGGIRQSIYQGDITLESVIGLLPFSNTIYSLKLTGKQVLDCTQNFCVGGFSLLTGKMSDGTPFDENKIYTVLTTDYLYSVNSTNFKKYDEKPYSTGILYRQPVIDKIKSLKTTQQNPINNYLDKIPRITQEAKDGDFH